MIKTLGKGVNLGMEGKMTITLQNIGLIKNAELDLGKDLILLCGPNNTGKTYASYTVYGLCRLTELTRLTKVEPALEYLPEGDSIASLSNVDLKKFYQERSGFFREYINKELVRFLPSIFGGSQQEFAVAHVSVQLDDQRVLENIRHIEMSRLIVSDGEYRLEKRSDSYRVTIDYTPSDPLADNEYSLLPTFLNRFVRECIMSCIVWEVHAEPTERIGVNLFSRELFEKKSNVHMAMEPGSIYGESYELRSDKFVKFPMPVREGLNISLHLDEISMEIGPMAHLAREVEDTILGGNIHLNQYGEVRFSPSGSEASLGLNMSGSVVKALASIVFYLRHQAMPGSMFIIDEPELTLHPDNQRKMARILARMVNAGIKVLMSTHSDYIVRELNNLIMLHTDRNPEKVAELMTKYGYTKDDLLDHRRVGAYMFTKDVSQIEVTETGFEVKTIDDEIHNLNNSSADIYFSLHD